MSAPTFALGARVLTLGSGVTLGALPGTTNSRDHGFVYAVEFDSGWIKVGRTSNPRSRIRDHIAGHPLASQRASRCWVSTAHTGYHDTEAILLAFTTATCSEQRAREFFRGCSFDNLVDFARLLPLSAIGATPQPRAAKRDVAVAGVDGIALRRLRSERRLSRAELARRSDVAYSFLREIEFGTKAASDITAHKLARGLEVPVEALRGDAA